jgi:HAD superfamily hydrolase (TIGR01509 family)
MKSALMLDETDAWIFDLDGVLTDTASLHLRAWTEVFDALFRLSPEGGEPPLAQFSVDDYLRLVDGEDRMAGIRNVVADRGLVVPEGTSDDPVGFISTWGLAKQKDSRYLELLSIEGPHPFASSVDVLHRLRSAGIDVAVVSASRHCAQVLEAAKLGSLIDVRVDGVTASVMELASKPDPAMFLEAARRLGVSPSRAVVIEDSLSGVRAGRMGGFGNVVGVDRVGGIDLGAAGANVVVTDLGELELLGQGPNAGPWRLVYNDPPSAEEGKVETLSTLGNGYFATRGARPWAIDDGVSYPGTYIAGVYNRLQSRLADQFVEMESIVNVPNWLPVTFRMEGGPWLGAEGVEISSHDVRIDLRNGVTVRRCLVVDEGGRRTAVIERRLVSMSDPHLAALELSFVPINWSGQLELRSTLDSGVVDDETVEDRILANRHLELINQGSENPADVWLRVRTVQSDITIAMAARCRIFGPHQELISEAIDQQGAPGTRFTMQVSSDTRITIEKIVAVFTSKDRAISEPGLAARRRLTEIGGFDECLTHHQMAWQLLWHRNQLAIRDESGSSSVLNLHLFHLLQVASPHTVELDAGMGARGLHGEGYRGHIFWDTLFAAPVLRLRLPQVSQALLLYRRRRLDEARRAAVHAGLRGALFPWQSGSDGRDETPTVLFNPRTERWMPDHSRLQRHVGLAIAFEAWQQWQVTADLDFLAGPCAELLFEVARCFASLVSWDEALERFRISGVVGPDEFHDGYPWREEPGVTDNAYTNVMAAWVFVRAIEAFHRLKEESRCEVIEQLGIDDRELALWDSISRLLHVPFHDGVISQFADYDRLETLDLADYRRRYHNVGRLDLILDSEGDTVRRYQVGKQADVLMLLYLFSAEELRVLLGRMSYTLDPGTIRRTIEYYAARVTHGSSLSRVVYSWVLARRDRQSSWRYFLEALESDLTDIQGGTTREGVHMGAMAGTVDIVQRCYSGLEVRDEALWLNPLLPPELSSVKFAVTFRGCELEVTIDQHRLRVQAAGGRAAPVTLMLSGEPVVLHSGRAAEVALKRPD